MLQGLFDTAPDPLAAFDSPAVADTGSLMDDDPFELAQPTGAALNTAPVPAAVDSRLKAPSELDMFDPCTPQASAGNSPKSPGHGLRNQTVVT